MRINQAAVSGTLESSDILVQVQPSDGNQLALSIDSVVKRQFGDAIEASIREVCQAMGVTSAQIYVNDRGALDCTIRARVESALLRAGEDDKA